MNDRPKTRQRILDASRQLFSQRGYANTTISEIAATIGIAEGNLWYHFRTKVDLVLAHEEQMRQAARERRAAYPSGAPKEGIFRRDLAVDLDILARSLRMMNTA